MGGSRYHGKNGSPPLGPGRMVGRAEVEASVGVLESWDDADALFPVKIPRSFFADDAPLAVLSQVLPDARESADVDFGVRDPVGDIQHGVGKWVVHKYRHRALLLLTRRCHLHCRYCFRRGLGHDGAEDPTELELEEAIDYLSQQGLTEVILSGGDPLAVRDKRLFDVIDRLRAFVDVIRIHTRAVVAAPERITQELIVGLSLRKPVWIVVHINHPAELTPAVTDALKRMGDAGLPLLNQSVLLRGINDDVETLQTLSEELVKLSVIPYYLHHPDPVIGTEHFQVSPDEGRRIVSELRRRVSGVAFPRYVMDSSTSASKVDV